MYLFFKIIILFNIYIPIGFADIVIQNVELRQPKEHDIGLMLDVTVLNTAENRRQSLDVQVNSEKCCISLSDNETLCNVANLVGGYFGKVQPLATKKFTLIWPTITLYNRFGFCNITLKSISNNETVQNIPHTINFNTMIQNNELPQILSELKNSKKNFKKCETVDLNPFANCKPVECEEKYFGQRSFFNAKTQLCEPAVKCATNENTYYDFILNECGDFTQDISSKEIDDIKNGAYDNNTWDLKPNLEETVKNIEEFENHEIKHGALKSVIDDKGDSINNSNINYDRFGSIVVMIFIILLVYITVSLIVYCLAIILTSRVKKC